jgi:hypothetical protein
MENTSSEYLKAHSDDIDKAVSAAAMVKKAAELTYTAASARMKAKKVEDAIHTGNKAYIWTTLQEHLRKYASFINRNSRITGIYLCQVDTSFYSSVTEADLVKQLKIVVGVVYAKEALSLAGKETFKTCLKKLLKEKGLFTDAQLKLL